MNRRVNRGDVRSRIDWRLWHFLKSVRRVIGINRPEGRVVFVLGCQRSGTSLMMDILDRDPRSRVFRENDAVFSIEDGLTLRPLDRVREVFGSAGTPFLAAKPLLDSHRATELLDSFPGAHVFWLFRHFGPVASSSLRRFGEQSGLKNLASINDSREVDWRNTGASKRVRDVVRELYDHRLSPMSAAALFWWARNQLFFEQELVNDERVFMVRYERLMKDPGRCLQAAYSHLGLDFPGNGITRDVRANPNPALEHPGISDVVRRMCEETWTRLLRAESETGSVGPEIASAGDYGPQMHDGGSIRSSGW